MPTPHLFFPYCHVEFDFFPYFACSQMWNKIKTLTIQKEREKKNKLLRDICWNRVQDRVAERLRWELGQSDVYEQCIWHLYVSPLWKSFHHIKYFESENLQTIFTYKEDVNCRWIMIRHLQCAFWKSSFKLRLWTPAKRRRFFKIAILSKPLHTLVWIKC